MSRSITARSSGIPTVRFERKVESLIGPQTRVLVDAGCGRTVPVLRKFLGKVDRLVGVELVPFTDVPPGIAYTLTAAQRRYTFNAQTVDVSVHVDLTGVTLVGQ